MGWFDNDNDEYLTPEQREEMKRKKKLAEQQKKESLGDQFGKSFEKYKKQQSGN